LADNYISDFVNRQKEKSAKEQVESEERARAAQLMLQQKVLVEEQAPAVWSNLTVFLTQKVAEINAAGGHEVIVLEAPSSDILVLHCGVKSLKLIFDTASQLIQVDAGFSTRRKWNDLHAIAEDENVRFAENTTRGFHPLTFDEIMQGLLSSFIV
jgi:hypothetical protein